MHTEQQNKRELSKTDFLNQTILSLQNTYSVIAGTNRHVSSMRRRCTAVVNADGGHTRYWASPLTGNFHTQTLVKVVIITDLEQKQKSA